MADPEVTLEGDAKPGVTEVNAIGTPGDPLKTFTQEDVNRIMATARKEEAAKFPDYGKLKGESDELANLKHEKLSEADRLREEMAAALKGRDEATAKLDAATVSNAITLGAVKKGFIDPGDALALVERAGISMDATAGVVGVGEALDALLVAKPHLKALAGAPDMNANAKRKAEAPVVLTVEQRKAADFLDVKEEDYAKNLQVRR